MNTKLTILADQVSFERRLSFTQLILIIGLFVFMSLSRGTFSILSPVMAAQQEERKRRESADNTSISKETSVFNQADSTVPEITTPRAPTSTIMDSPNNEMVLGHNPIPYNRRRHSDNICHLIQSKHDPMMDDQRIVPSLVHKSRSDENCNHNSMRLVHRASNDSVNSAYSNKTAHSTDNAYQRQQAIEKVNALLDQPEQEVALLSSGSVYGENVNII
ncbi:hypothetical protein BDB01DRAFT_804420, partial [Pilobolus umbonatus]